MAGANEWNEDLCGCTDDCGTCCYGCWCTPCLFGSNAEKIDGKNCFVMCCAYALLTHCYLCWLPHLFERKKLREKHNLKENPSCGDCPTTLCCGPCALCQEAREMKIREKNLGPAYAPQPQGPGYAAQPQGPAYAPQPQGPGYAPQPQGLAYATQLQGPTYAPQLQDAPVVVMQPMSQMKDFSQGNMQY